MLEFGLGCGTKLGFEGGEVPSYLDCDVAQ